MKLTLVLCGLFAFPIFSIATEVPVLRPTTEEMQCKKASDCELTAVACACDYGMFVNRMVVPKMEAKLIDLCTNYSGKVCKMAAVFMWASCEKNICTTHMVNNRDCSEVKDKLQREKCWKIFPRK